MNIENIACHFSTEKISFVAPERVLYCKLIVTVRNGDDLIDVDLYQDVDQLETLARKAVIKKLKKLEKQLSSI